VPNAAGKTEAAENRVEALPQGCKRGLVEMIADMARNDLRLCYETAWRVLSSETDGRSRSFPTSGPFLWKVMLGYRGLYQDFESNSDNGFKYDTTMHGPMVALSIDFGQWYRIK
jgi:hypothetical protein